MQARGPRRQPSLTAPERPRILAPRLLLQLVQSHGLLAACAGLLVSLVGLQALSADE